MRNNWFTFDLGILAIAFAPRLTHRHFETARSNFRPHLIPKTEPDPPNIAPIH